MLRRLASLIRPSYIFFFNQIYLYLKQVHFFSVKNTKDQHVSLVTMDPITLLPASYQLLGLASSYLHSGPKLSWSHWGIPPSIRKRKRQSDTPVVLLLPWGEGAPALRSLLKPAWTDRCFQEEIPLPEAVSEVFWETPTIAHSWLEWMLTARTNVCPNIQLKVNPVELQSHMGFIIMLTFVHN